MKGAHTDNAAVTLRGAVERAVQALDFAWAHRVYWDQNECIFLERFLSPGAVAALWWLFVQ